MVLLPNKKLKVLKREPHGWCLGREKDHKESLEFDKTWPKKDKFHVTIGTKRI